MCWRVRRDVHGHLKKGLLFGVEDRAWKRDCVVPASAAPGLGSCILSDARYLALLPGLATNVRFVPYVCAYWRVAER